MPARVVLIICLLLAVLWPRSSIAADVADFLQQFKKVTIHEQPIDLRGLVLDTPDGPFALANQRGKWLLLNVWATWCAPCIAELPELDRLRWMRADRDFDVLVVSVDRKLNASRIAYHLKRWQAPRLVPLHDGNRQLAKFVDIAVLPVTHVIDPTGRAVAALYGPARWSSHRALDFIDTLKDRPETLALYGKRDKTPITP